MIYFDIETGPLPIEQIEKIMPEFKAAGNIKDPEKIKADIESKKREFVERAALSPLTGEILAIGYRSQNFETIHWSDGVGGEKELITKFFEIIRDRSHDIVGFNSNSFDIPFICRRAWLLGLEVPKDLLGRYLPDRFIDLLVIWKLRNFQDSISLNQLAKYFGLGEKKGDAEDFSTYYRENREKAAEYLTHDVLLTQLIGQRMGIAPSVQGNKLPMETPV